MDCRTHSPDIYIFLSKFWNFELLYLVLYRPNKQKLEDFLNLDFVFLTLWVSCCLPHHKRTLIHARFEIR